MKESTLIVHAIPIDAPEVKSRKPPPTAPVEGSLVRWDPDRLVCSISTRSLSLERAEQAGPPATAVESRYMPCPSQVSQPKREASGKETKVARHRIQPKTVVEFETLTLRLPRLRRKLETFRQMVPSS